MYIEGWISMITSQLLDRLYNRLSNRTFPAGARKMFQNELKSASEYIAKNERGIVVFPYDDILYLQGLVEELNQFKVSVDQFEIISEPSGNHQLFNGKKVALLYHIRW